MSRPLRVLAAALCLTGLLAPPARAAALPAPPAAQGAQIAALVEGLSRDSTWTLVDQVRLQGDTWHPEGIVHLGDRWIVSAVQVTEPTVKYPPGAPSPDGSDRTPGAGFGHLLAFAADGTRLDDEVLNAPGALEYHPGGLDYDGRRIWVTNAQYRPNSTATFLRVDPRTLRTTPVLRARDHFGGVVHDTARHRLVTLNWGSRQGATWAFGRGPSTAFAQPLATRRNPSHFVDYQDCKYLGRVPDQRNPLMLCGGITAYGTFQLGGIALVDTKTLAPVHEVPITTLTPAGNVLTRNPIDVAVVDGKLRLSLAPDDDATTVFTYQAG